MNFKRHFIIISFLTLSVTVLVTCMNKKNADNSKASAVEANNFAGSASCAGCHKDIYQSHLKTAHYLTSRKAAEKYIKGSFAPGKNKFLFNDGIELAMEKRDSNFYQVRYVDGVENLARRFDIVFGSGKKGQSYLDWYNNKLFQLPITYFTATNTWSNSPGYPDKAVFNRPITSRCMECHTTYAQKISDVATEPEEFDRNNIIYGVDCEKCHGAASAHVKFQTENPQEKHASFVVNTGKLSRQQSIDMCALCHGGHLTKTAPSFQFMPGDTLSDFFKMDTLTNNVNDIDVHGNQYVLLAASRCFKGSNMTCSSCHNTHENETGNKAIFSQRCITCHNSEHGKLCTMDKQLGVSINKNCIDCHMPEQPSRAIAVLLQGQFTPTPAKMRSHFIKIYPEETKKLLPFFKKIQFN